MVRKSGFALVCVLLAGILLAGCGGSPSGSEEEAAALTVDSLAGDWAGMMISENGEALTELNISVQEGCEVDKACGSYSIPEISCSGDLVYKGVDGEAFSFEQHLVDGDLNTCGTGSMNTMTLNEDDTISQTWTDGTYSTHAALTRK